MADGTRMSWLDALRGLAALAVVWWHLGPHALPAAPPAEVSGVDVGKWGVVLFFAVSGYVIPMSLERHGSQRRFWISRGFRLYPAWAVASLLMLAAAAAGATTVPGMLADEPVAGALAHATMLQGLLGVSNLVPVYWTLSYEMVFYLAVAGLFALGLHRHSAWYAAGTAVAAVLAAPVLPDALLTADGGRRLAAAAALLVAVAAAVAGLMSRRRAVVVAAAVLAACAPAVAALNGGEAAGRASWQSLVLLAVMVAGTVVYRVQHGQLHPAAGAAAVVTVLAAGVGGGYAYLDDDVARRVWASTLLLSAAAFAVAFLLRRARVPGVLRWLGRLSYSVYLLHLVLLPVLLHLLPGLAGRPLPVRAAALAGFLVVLLGLSHLVYRYVEAPAQRLGRRVARRADPAPAPRDPAAPPAAPPAGTPAAARR